MIIQMIQEDIDKARKSQKRGARSSTTCPVFRALKRNKLPVEFVSLDIVNIAGKVFKLNKKVINFIKIYDFREEVTPIKFSIRTT